MDIMRLEGIFRKGYGVVPKFVMHDQDLTLESKAIYAYLCALAGSGQQTFPFRDTILREVGLSKNTYYRHYNPLVEQGYITVERPADRNAANIYTLVSNPKKLEMAEPQAPDPGKAFLRVRGLRAHGYGTIPKAVMRDDRLTVKAKGLYAYFCSYGGAGDHAFPSRSNILYHLGISEPTYYKAYNLLRETGYLITAQRTVAGKFSVNDYYLNEFPGKEIPALSTVEQIDSAEHGSEDPTDLTCLDRTQDKTAPLMSTYAIASPELRARRVCGFKPPAPLQRADIESANTTTARRVRGLRPPCPRNGDTKKLYPRNGDIKNWDDIVSNTSFSNNSLSNNSPSNRGAGLTDVRREVLNKLRAFVSAKPLGRSTVLWQALGVMEKLLAAEGDKLSQEEAAAALWLGECLDGPDGGDRLLEALTVFQDSFRKKMAGKDVRNVSAYLRASLCNWIGEAPLREKLDPSRPVQAPDSAASYDLAEMEEMIERGLL